MGRRPRLDDNPAEENPDAGVGAAEHGKVPHLPTASLKTVPPPSPQTIILPSAPSYPTTPPPRTGAQRTVPVAGDGPAYPGSSPSGPQWSGQQQPEGPWGSGPFDEASERPVGLGDPWGQHAPTPVAGPVPPGYPSAPATAPGADGFPGSGFPTDFSDQHGQDARRGMFPTAARPIVTPQHEQPQGTYIAEPADLHQQSTATFPPGYSPQPGNQSAHPGGAPQRNGPECPTSGYSAPQTAPQHGEYHASPVAGHAGQHATPQPMTAPGGPESYSAASSVPEHEARHSAGNYAANHSMADQHGVDLRSFDQQGAGVSTSATHRAQGYQNPEPAASAQGGLPPHAPQHTAPGAPSAYPAAAPSPSSYDNQQPAAQQPGGVLDATTGTDSQQEPNQPSAVPFGQTQHFGFHPGAKHPGAGPVRGELPAGSSSDHYTGQQQPHNGQAQPQSGQPDQQAGHGQPYAGQAGQHSGQPAQHNGQTQPQSGQPDQQAGHGQPYAGQAGQHSGQPHVGLTHPAAPASDSGVAPAQASGGVAKGFDFEAQKLPMIAIMSALIVGVIVGTILGVNLRGGEEQAPAESLPQDIGVTETSMPCEAGKTVAFIGAAMPPEAIFTASQTAQEFQAKAQSVGLPPSSVKMSSADQVCESALKNYSVPETGKMYVWGGAFESPERAKEWCEKLGRSDLVNQCIIRTMA